MSKLPSLALSGAAAIALAATAPVPAQAGAVHLTPTFGSVASESNVVEVRRRHRRNSWIALGVGSAIVGGMIAAQRPAYGYGPAYGGPAYGYGSQRGYVSSGWDECAARFRSLRADGTYTTYDGRQVLCPYLR